MGVLKARVAGAWVNIGVNGGPLPPGGVAGDILVKQSATLSDATWGTTMPKLKLTPGSVVGIDLNNPALQVGEQTLYNLVAYQTGLMARNNGAVSALRLNYYGGDVLVGDGNTAQYPGGLRVGASAHATSRRAQISLGTEGQGWQLGQDFSANGTRDLYLYQQTNARLVMSVSADGMTINLGTANSASRINLGGPGSVIVGIGDDVYFQDLNITNGIALRGVANANLGRLAFGNGNDWVGYDGEMRMVAAATLTFQGNSFQVLNSAASGWKFRSDAAGQFDVWGPTYIHGNFYADNGVYCGTGEYFRVRGTGTGVFWHDIGSGVISPDASTIATYGGQAFQGKRVSGGWYHEQTLFANPGSTMCGVGLHPGGTAGSMRFQMNQGRFYFNNADGGGFYDTLANAYILSSTERSKQEMVPLVEALPAMPRLPVATMVRALRPVWYRQREDAAMMSMLPRPLDLPETVSWNPGEGETFLHVCYDEGNGNCGHTPDDPCNRRVNWLRGQLGFIAEEVEQVLPHLTQLGPDMQPDSVNLGSLIGLAYAMLQELDSRLNALEAA